MKKYCFLIGFLFSIGTLTSVQAQVKALLDSTQFLIGDQAIIHLQLNRAKEIGTMKINSTVFDEIEGLEYLRHGAITKEKIATGWLYNKDITVALFDTGDIWIPSIPILIDKEDTIFSQRIPIQVRPPQIDSLTMAPIKPILREGNSIVDYLWIIGSILAVIGLVILFFMRKKKRAAMENEVKIYIPTAIENAESALENLDAKQLWSQEKFKEQAVGLSTILRKYLEEEWTFPALESTTREIKTKMNKAKIETEMIEQSIDQLQLMDMVKYAKVKPNKEHMSTAVTLFKNLINALHVSFVEKNPPLEKENEDA